MKNKLGTWGIFLVCLFCVQSGFGEEIRYKPLKMAVSQGDKLVVKGFAGELKLVPDLTGKATELVIQIKQKNPTNAPDFAKELFEEWMFVMERRDAAVHLMVKGPSSRKNWSPLLRQGGFPEFTVVVTGPSLPASISWWKGKVSVENWKHALEVSLLDGVVHAANNEGDLRVFNEKGKIGVLKHSNSLKVHTYSSKVTVAEIKGDVELNNFSGRTSLSKIEGDIRFEGFKGGLHVFDSKGKVNFKTGQTTVKVVNIDGGIRGRVAQGPVFIDLKEEAQVDVRTKEGNVSLNLRNSGAQLNLGSKEGGIYAPSYFRTTNYSTIRVKQGRLRGRQTGRVFVRTDSGIIKVK